MRFKKGNAEYIPFVILILVAVGMFLVSLAILNLVDNGQERIITATIIDTQNNYQVINLLKTPTEKGTLGELLALGYDTGNYALFIEETNKALKQAYGQEVPWDFAVNSVGISGYGGERSGSPKTYNLTVPGIAREDTIPQLSFTLTLWRIP